MKFNLPFYHFLLFAALLAGLFGCDIKKNKEVKPTEDFFKVFDNLSFSDNYIPLDIKQTSDEGYVILAKTRISTSPFYGIYLLKIDKEGNFVSDQMVSSTYVAPNDDLLLRGNALYLFCMNSITLQTVLLKIDEQANYSKVNDLPGLVYPLSSAVEGSNGNLLLQSYDKDNKLTIVSKITTQGVVLDSVTYQIGIGNFDIEEPVINHLTGNGKRLPFFTGSMGNGTYYFNGFYNYTLSCAFFDFGSTTPKAVLQGYNDERCVSSAVYLPSVSKFSLSRFAYGTTTLCPFANVNYTTGLNSNTDITGYTVPEFNYDSRVVVKNLALMGQPTLVYGSDTKSGQLALYMYDASNGAFKTTMHFGYSNTFFMGNFTKTTDDGLAIAGVTYLSGRFPRLCLFKVSKSSLEKL